MPILSFLLGVLLTWLFMSGLMAQGLALFIRIWWPSSSRERELQTDQWLLNNPIQPSSAWRLLGYWKETSQYHRRCSVRFLLLVWPALSKPLRFYPLKNVDKTAPSGLVYSLDAPSTAAQVSYDYCPLTARARKSESSVKKFIHKFCG